MTTHLTPSLRAQALAAKFGNVYYEEGDGYGSANTFVDGLLIYVDAIGDDLSVSVQYLHMDGPPRTLLRLSGFQDDDLVESMIRQFIDHHNGKQVI